MALEKTATKGIYKAKGKKGKISYVLMYYEKIPDNLSESGFRWRPKGKRFAKYQDAVDFKVKSQSDVKSGNYTVPSELTVEQLAKEWLGSEPHWKRQTYLGYEMQINKHIAPVLGSFKAVKLSAPNVRAASVEWLKV